MLSICTPRSVTKKRSNKKKDVEKGEPNEKKCIFLKYSKGCLIEGLWPEGDLLIKGEVVSMQQFFILCH